MADASASRDAAAGRPRSRRDFLASAAAGAVGLAAAGCGWRGGPLEPLLEAWWRPNELLQKALVPAGRRAPTEPEAALREGRMPAYWISDEMPTTDVASWRLLVGGMASNPLVFTLDDLLGLPMTTLRVRHYCIEGWTAVAEWTGVRMDHLAELIGADPAADYVEFRSFDSGYWSSWDRESALHPQTIVALAKDGERLTPEYGAPARLYSNLKYGYKVVKYLTEIQFMPRRTGGYWEDRGYDWYAGL